MSKIPIRFLIAAGLTLLPRAAAAEARPEGRALWVVRSSLVSPASVDSAIARAVQVHATDLFVQVRGRGDAFYPSKLVPYAEAVRDPSFDGLAYAVERGHAHGLAVHAWLNVFLLWSVDHRPPSPQHILNAHPEWLDMDRAGRSMASLTPAQNAKLGAEGAWVAPSDTAFRAHFADIVRELLAAYPLDGIHLDYVRYPSPAVGFTPAMREGFARAHGADPVKLDRHDGELRRAWDEYRAEQVTALVRAVRTAVDGTRPGTLLSAAVRPDPVDALASCGQDWPRWMAEGLLDFAAPMCYGTRASTVARQMRLAQEAAAGRPLYLGVAVYNQGAGAAVEKVRLARSLGAAGIALFSYDAIAPRNDYWDRLARDVFAEAPTALAWARQTRFTAASPVGDRSATP